MLSLCGLLLCLLAGSHQLKIEEFVVPQSTQAGSDVELRCGYSLDANEKVSVVRWWFTPLYGPKDRVYLSQRVEDGDAEAIHGVAIAGKDDIILKKVDHTRSGTYECQVDGNLAERRVHSDLIVFSNGTGPQLNISVMEDGADADTEEDLLLECHADDVTPQPELVISANGRPVSGAIQYLTRTSESMFNVFVNATVTKADLDAVEVKCELFFVNHNITHLPFFDVETYSSGTAPTPVPPESPPANATQLGSSPLPQPNHSSGRSLSCWVWVVAAMLPFLRAL